MSTRETKKAKKTLTQTSGALLIFLLLFCCGLYITGFYLLFRLIPSLVEIIF